MNSGFWHFLKQYGWITLISSVLLVSLTIMSQILQNASSFADTYSALLFFTLGGVGVLLFVLLKTLWNLRQQAIRQIPGIRITIRLTSISTLMLGIPTAIIFYFSLTFIQQGINQWFDVKTETALENASALVRMTLDNKTRDSLKLTLSAVKERRQRLVETPATEISQLRALLNAQEVALYHTNQQLIAFSSENIGESLPDSPGDNLFQQIRQNKTYAAVESLTESTFKEQFIRVIIPFSGIDATGHYALQAIFPVSSSMTELAESVAIASGQYKELSYLKGPLITSFTLILTMVFLLTLVTSVLFTIQAVQNFTRPIRLLAHGTRQVSKGDYNVKMDIKQKDEFGDLTQSFNDMIQRISHARNDLKLSHKQTEIQKLYLQAIIKNLTSGVITLDMNHRIRTSNDAAKNILNADLNLQTGKRFEEVIVREDNRHLTELFALISPYFSRAKSIKPWTLQHEFSCKNGPKILMVHGSTLPSIDQKIGGYVIVMDDITELVQAQKHAAWSDVARRLAHEIKNPLTPIQLSAERLNFKLHPKLVPADQALLERMTHTIIEQVSTMQALVQAFSDYANTPDIKLEKTDINQLVCNVTEMYQDPTAHWTVQANIDSNCPVLLADSARLRQLLHNLIKNALEAMENTIQPKVTLTTYCDQAEFLTLKICDNGPGIPESSHSWIFEPYASDKPKGSGLGLAIVHKIVDEHHGQIAIKSSPETGSCFIIKLPLHAHADQP